MRRVLVVSYTFPPVGGAGVQRVTKFVKYLPQHGWLPTVLTVANPSVPVLDHSLDADVPAEVKVVRARSLEPSYALKKSVGTSSHNTHSAVGSIKQFLRNVARSTAGLLLQPDTQVLWYPKAVSVGRGELNSMQYDAVLVTAPPFSAFLIGNALARRARLPLLLDYRDEWTISNDYLENKRLGTLSQAIQTRMENSVLRSAHSVVATTQASAASLRQRCAEAKANVDVSCIYNGFDVDDFLHLQPVDRNRSLCRIVYTGTLWNLTSIAPFVDALRRLEVHSPELVERIEVVLVGRKVGGQLDQVQALRATRCQVVEHDYLDHTRALNILGSADAVCLLLSDVPGAERVVPAKLFEYVACRRPILAILPHGESWDLLNDVPRASRLLPSDTSGIARWLSSAVNSQELRSDQGSSEVPDGFDRRSQARQLAETLEKMVASHHS